MDKVVNDETIMLRTLARKYDVELVDARREWIDYLRANKFKQTDLTDQTQVHMNRKGVVLMAQLYERHFQASPLPRGAWMNDVRYYSAARQLRRAAIRRDHLGRPGLAERSPGGGGPRGGKPAQAPLHRHARWTWC